MRALISFGLLDFLLTPRLLIGLFPFLLAGVFYRIRL
jgi:hypothetical protein